MKLLILFVGFIGLTLGLPPSPPLPGGSYGSRIIGGNEAAPGQFRFIASLRIAASNFHFCGGSIITNKHILSAGHCNTYSVDSIKATVGTNDVEVGGQDYSVASFVTHEDYQFGGYYANDIAIVTLEQDIVFGALVAIIGLTTVDTPVGESLTAIGWGATDVGGSEAPRYLQYVDTQSISYEQCVSLTGDFPLETQICTLNEPGHGICYGDSGGPLISSGAKLHGLSSLSYCGQGLPDFFTRIWDYKEWIDTHTDGLLGA